MTGAEDRYFVCPAETLPPGERRITTAGDVEVGVFNLNGEYVALANECPHRGGPVCTGVTLPALTAEWVEPSERVRERMEGDPSLTCPWHGWEFDVATGVHLGDSSIAVQTFEVDVTDGDVYVTL